MSGDASRFFSTGYASCRAVFLAAAAARGLTPAALANETAQGPGGEALCTDVVELGDRDAPALLVLISATHGVEGFCGSGCQTGLLRSMPPDWPPRSVRVVLVHALNPFGFAWLRRVNEDNVDLNRNFVDHDARHPDNPAYDALAADISPADVSADALKAANAALRAYRDRHGAMALQSAATSGQYRHPKGIYYGGVAPTWSNRVLHTVMRDYAGAARRVGVVDFHTGLGPYGYGELICEQAEDHPLYLRARNWWGESVTSTVAGSSTSAHLTGTIDGAAPGMLPNREVTAVALEFGTSPPNEVFSALRLDNWLHAYGDPQGPEAAAIKAEIRRVFYPDTDDWKEMVWARAREVVAQAIAGLSAPKSF